MKKIISLFIALILFSSLSVLAGESVVEALIIERDIIYGEGYNLGQRAKNPLLSYNNLTYVSVKDVATMLGAEAVWRGEEKGVLIKPLDDCHVVKSDQMALKIGKAAIEEYFSDKVNENTVYISGLTTPISTGLRQYNVLVKFNTDKDFNIAENSDEIVTNNDAFVSIDPISGQIYKIRYKDEDGNYVDLLD